jgi:hypothetical protein
MKNFSALGANADQELIIPFLFPWIKDPMTTSPWMVGEREYFNFRNSSPSYCSPLGEPFFYIVLFMVAVMLMI